MKEEERSELYRTVNLREMNEADGDYFVINEISCLETCIERLVSGWGSGADRGEVRAEKWSRKLGTGCAASPTLVDEF